MLLFFSLSCSSLKKESAKSLPSFITGPLPARVDLEEVRKDLSRWTTHKSIGDIKVLLFTPAYIYRQALEKKKNNELNHDELIRKVNIEIDHLVRYESCFALSLTTHNPIATEFNYWKAHIAYGRDLILPVKIKNVTKHIKAPKEKDQVFKIPAPSGEYKAQATLCTTDRMNIHGRFTLVLKPDFKPGLPSLRLTWEKSPTRNNPFL